MRMSCAEAARRVMQSVGRRVRRHRRRGGILMYHCICETSCDPWGICVSPRAFDEQMAVLAQAGAAADLAGFTDGTGVTSGGTRIAVTFDDGYVDNLHAALPILERHEIPATVFVVGNAVGRTREFWWDGLQRALLESGDLPPTLHFPFGNGRHRFTLEQRPGDRETSAAWRADVEEPNTARQRLFRRLWGAIVVLEPAEQDAAVDHLLDWAGQPLQTPSSRLPLSGEQVAELAAHPLITLGSHTADHASLTDLPPERQHAQITRGRRRVEELSGYPVTRFSYPFGRFDAGTRSIVQGSGVEVACTSVPVTATAGDDRFALPRLQAVEMDGDRFGRWLRGDHALLAGTR